MKDITVKLGITIREAMKALDKTAENCLLIVDDDNKLLGTLTDGDLRRSILAGANFSENISTSYNQTPTLLIQNKYTIVEAKQLLNSLKLDLIPIVDENNTVLDYVNWSTLGKINQIKKTLNNVPVVIMAGGKGTRMEPFTKILPKPLIPIHDKSIIEHIIERFTDKDCADFYLTINHKGKIIKAYFEELQPSYNISFVDEKDPLGTAGSLQYLKGKFSKSFFVTNCDIIVNIDYNTLYEFHQKGDFDITLVASAKEYIIPYGTCALNSEGQLSHIDEKPKYNFLINTGLYILSSDILELIPENKFYHITHLIEDAKNQGKKVGVFPIDDEAWIDVGQWAEYKKAVAKL